MKVFISRSLSHGNANIIYQYYNIYIRSIYKLNHEDNDRLKKFVIDSKTL